MNHKEKSKTAPGTQTRDIFFVVTSVSDGTHYITMTRSSELVYHNENMKFETRQENLYCGTYLTSYLSVNML
jgi:hypothetical protein